jgi:hypothetical protein
MRSILILAILIVLPACEPEPAPPRVASALPGKVCADARAAVKAAAESNALILNSPVEAMIMHEAWLGMPQAHRDALAQAMGIAATCAEGRPRLEQEVVIRSDTGIVLSRRVVETSFSLPTM